MSKEINLPVFSSISRENPSSKTKGSLAAGKLPKPKIANQLTEIALDEESLNRTLDAAYAIASAIKNNERETSGPKLKEFEVTIGVSATGKVGLLGTGIDFECEASFTAKFSTNQL